MPDQVPPREYMPPGRAEALPEDALATTQWGVRYSDLRGVLEVACYDDEEDARDHTLGISPPLTATVVSRRLWWTRWADAPRPAIACRHCQAPIEPCTAAHSGNTDLSPLCKGWRHIGYDSQPVIGHCCEGRSINPAAEPDPQPETTKEE